MSDAMVKKNEGQSSIIPGATLGRILGRWIFLAVFFLLNSPPFVLADPQSPGSDQSNNAWDGLDGDATRKVFDKQDFPWYDSLKREFVPILGQKAPEKKPESPPPELPDSGKWFNLAPGPIFFWILLAVILIAVVVFLIRFDWAGLKSEESPKTDTKVEIETEKIAALPLPVRGKGDLLSRAEEFAARGQFGEAITFYHSWQLLRLDKTGHIELQSGKTNRAYLGELSEAPTDLRDIFRQSTRLFEDAFYGGLNIDGGAFQLVWKNRTRFESPLPSLKGHK